MTLARSSFLLVPALAAVSALALASAGHAQERRDQIRITGSSTVFPFSTAVAEQFASKTGHRAPIVESTGTGGGLKQLCEGVGAATPDIADASRRIKASELRDCRAHGATDIMEVKVGYDGIVLANAKGSRRLDLTRKQIFQAVAANLPESDTDCTMHPNTHILWSDVDPALPQVAIEVYGPPPTSGTRDAFVEVALDAGARAYPCLAVLEEHDPNAYRAAAQTIREDGAWIDAGENDNAIVATLERTPSAVGVFGFSFLDQNADRIQGSIVDGKEPDFDNIADHSYPISRELYIYVKKQHIGLVPGIEEFLDEYLSEDAAGEFGYLAEKGLIPMPEEERLAVAAAVKAQETLTGDEGL